MSFAFISALAPPLKSSPVFIFVFGISETVIADKLFSRKMKLREKQKKGKAKMKERGKVNIPHDVFLKMMRNE